MKETVKPCSVCNRYFTVWAMEGDRCLNCESLDTIGDRIVAAPSPPEPFLGDEVLILVGDEFASMSDQMKAIQQIILPQVISMFLKKSMDYGDTSFELGSKGQFAEIWRKVGKLKGPMWEEQSLEFEQMDEILMDLIGHCLLALYFVNWGTETRERDDEMAIQQAEARELLLGLVKRINNRMEGK